MRRLETFALGLAIALGAPLAHADGAADAERLFREGRARMVAGDPAGACPRFAESLRLDFALGTLLNLAACEEELGQLADASDHFAVLAARLPVNDDRRPFVLDRASKLERRVPRLTVALARAPTGTVVTRDGVVLGATALGEAIPVNPGEHRVTVVAPGRAAARFSVTVRESERRSLVVAPGEPAAPAVERRDGPPTKRTVGWVVGGVGVLALGTGAYFGARSLVERSRSDALCDGTTCRDASGVRAYDDARTSARIADVALGAGVLAVGVATYLVLSSRTSEAPAAPARAAIRITPFGVGGVW